MPLRNETNTTPLPFVYNVLVEPVSYIATSARHMVNTESIQITMGRGMKEKKKQLQRRQLRRDNLRSLCIFSHALTGIDLTLK